MCFQPKLTAKGGEEEDEQRQKISSSGLITLSVVTRRLNCEPLTSVGDKLCSSKRRRRRSKGQSSSGGSEGVVYKVTVS